MKKLVFWAMVIILPFLFYSACFPQFLGTTNGNMYFNIRNSFRAIDEMVATMLSESSILCENEALHSSDDISERLDYYERCMVEYTRLETAISNSRMVFSRIELIDEMLQEGENKEQEFFNLFSLLLINGNRIKQGFVDLNVNIPIYFQEALDMIELIISQRRYQ